MKHIQRHPSSANHLIAVGAALMSFMVGIFLMKGCQNKQTSIRNNQPFQQQEINDLKIRIEQLERHMVSRKLKPSQEIYKRANTGHIKSVTLRIGTKDDRLRIYWTDGSKSDLPCTKEQSIWVCG